MAANFGTNYLHANMKIIQSILNKTFGLLLQYIYFYICCTV